MILLYVYTWIVWNVRNREIRQMNQRIFVLEDIVHTTRAEVESHQATTPVPLPSVSGVRTSLPSIDASFPDSPFRLQLSIELDSARSLSTKNGWLSRTQDAHARVLAAKQRIDFLSFVHQTEQPYFLIRNGPITMYLAKKTGCSDGNIQYAIVRELEGEERTTQLEEDCPKYCMTEYYVPAESSSLSRMDKPV